MDSLVESFASERGYVYNKRDDFYILLKGKRCTIVSFGDDCLFSKTINDVPQQSKSIPNHKEKQRTPDKIQKNLSRNKDRLVEDKKKEEKILSDEKYARIQELETNYILNFYVKNTKFLFFARLRDPKLLDLVISEKTIDLFMTCGYFKTGNDRAVQYIGYSYWKSEINRVIIGKMDEEGCATRCSCHVPPRGPRYHVVLTKKVRGNFEGGYVNFHYPNGTQQEQIEDFDYHGHIRNDPIYSPYVIHNSVRYYEYQYEFRWGGEQSFLVKGDEYYFSSYHDSWQHHRDMYY